MLRAFCLAYSLVPEAGTGVRDGLRNEHVIQLRQKSALRPFIESLCFTQGKVELSAVGTTFATTCKVPTGNEASNERKVIRVRILGTGFVDPARLNNPGLMCSFLAADAL